ncbi:MAG: hypothetical protein LBD53_02130 [Tannerella sp.]|nr:hypothetical protein [Tannerella sp.]
MKSSYYQSIALFLLCATALSFFNCKVLRISYAEKQTEDDAYGVLRDAFVNPSPEARPKCYWWCLNGNIDTVRAKQEMRAMKEVGITGFDIFEIGTVLSDTVISGGPAFMSDESIRLIKFAVDEAAKLGLTVGLNLASSWNAGGSWVQPRHGAKSLYMAKISVAGGETAATIKVPFPNISFSRSSLVGAGSGRQLITLRPDGRPDYYEDIAVLAIPQGIKKGALDTTDIIDVTSQFDPATDELRASLPQGQWEIVRYVCSNSGQQIVLPSPNSAGLTIDHFDAEAVESHLMYFINKLQPVLGDFRKTPLKSFYLASYEARGMVWTPTLPKQFVELNGYEISKYLPSFFDREAFEAKTYARVQSDFRKTLSELMINNLYRKSAEICHRYGLQINSEAGGPGYPLYNGPAEPLKAQGSIDIPRGEFWINHSRFYKDGTDSIDILRVVKETAAASHIYRKGIVEMEAFTSFMHWQEAPCDMRPFGDRAFCEGMNKVVFHGFSHNIGTAGYPGYVYNAGTHFNDKQTWWSMAKPFTDYLSRLSAVFQKADFKADILWYYGDKVPNSATPKNTHFKVPHGFDYEVINTDILVNDLTFNDGKFRLSNGAEFSVLYVESEEDVNPAAAAKLEDLKRRGGKITQTPARVVNVPPDLFDCDDALDFIHYVRGNVDVYFVRNTLNEALKRIIGFRQKDKTPEIWDAVSGNIIPVTDYEVADKYISLPVTFERYGSIMIVFREKDDSSSLTDIKSGDKQSNYQTIKYLEGSWDVEFTAGWGAPEKVSFPTLMSWTDSEIEGVKYYSGIATYSKSFTYYDNTDSGIFLDLGEVSKAAKVWLNDKEIGIGWTKPYRFNVSGVIVKGENRLKIEVANVWSNRIVGDALTGQKFTNTNMTSTMIPAPTMATGDQTRYRWKDVPLIRSGLLGPVRIEEIKNPTLRQP